jgi:Domain of unknown function (DUF4413)
MPHERMRPTRTTSHIFRSFLQRNRSTIMLVHTIRASIASTSLFDIQGLFFSSCIFSLQILNYFITNLFYFFKVYHDFENIDLRRIAEDVHGDSPLSPIIEVMREKFLKYWDKVPLITIIVNYLHPSFKKKYTIRLLEQYKKKSKFTIYRRGTTCDIRIGRNVQPIQHPTSCKPNESMIYELEFLDSIFKHLFFIFPIFIIFLAFTILI